MPKGAEEGASGEDSGTGSGGGTGSQHSSLIRGAGEEERRGRKTGGGGRSPGSSPTQQLAQMVAEAGLLAPARVEPAQKIRPTM